MERKNMRYALCAFPLVGLLCGVLWCVCGVLPLPAPARAAGFCLVPVWVTGGIHLDGYADTCDALASYGDREKKLEILKTRTAVPLRSSGCAAILRLTSASPPVCSSPPGGRAVDAGADFGAGTFRPCGGGFPMAKNTGLAHTFASAADRTAVRNVLAVLAILLCGRCWL
ncbi:MAG: adenosylcobinamide-GDP ribazoletransferase [Faecalibacterium prausnitzii]